jgi:chromosome condensin MukBEF ATPase and DNA-binding subunit MukB
MVSMIETTQKLIQIGSSEGITLSKKDIAQLGAKRGDTLKVRVELVKEPSKHKDLLNEYDLFVEKYGQTLKNLADR